MPRPRSPASPAKAHAAGSRIVGLCMGAFVVAAAGLLENRPATTHWRWASDFQRLYPSVQMDKDVLYIDNGDVVTSAGTAASIDCCLHLVRQAWGAEVANSVARLLVVPPHRRGGQRQYVELPVQNTRRGDNFTDALTGDGKPPACAHAGLRGGKSLHEPSQLYPAFSANHR